ncbi:hypothetical protein ISN76_03575 [Dyella halodurans]|uniref:Uncharacterized protein n=1 Tax=Dyella halodurans TaxID=1920171 RepID=A0ABV9BX45_9GAMM|nr:hypothetical protein [Dyella halodurans]
MSSLFRPWLKKLLGLLARYPALKRFVVNVVYRFPALDAGLRTVAHRTIHPEAALDVDATRMPETSRRAFDRIRARKFP